MSPRVIPLSASANELTLTRSFEAPRALVFRMWAEPEHMSAWSCPHGFAVVESGGQFQPGGAWHAHMRSPDGQDYRLRGVYREIVTNERLSFTHAWLDASGKPGPETVVTVTFESRGDNTRMTLHQSGFDSKESINGHVGGWTECLDKLEAHMRGLPSKAA